MKILSPVGNFESLKMAVFSGADEVYLGINNFNARNNIDGFDKSNLEEAVDFAHIFGVKVNLAINILFADEELQPALDSLIEAYNFGVDSFILQDLGLIKLVAENFPQIEIHASTQMGLHNLEGVQALEKYHFKRVVLARETPLREIKRIKDNCSLEVEYFAQGALCVSFSGNCYLSSYLCNASGNRGRCKQLCRLPYKFEKDGKVLKSGYLLSAKDFNMLDRLDDLKEAGVDVIKIEGRARRPFYVGVTTAEYFKRLQNQKADKERLKLAFNREFTAGYFDGNGKIISDFNSHIGLKIGKIEKVVSGKRFNEVFITSNRLLSAKSTFKTFEGIREKTTLTAYDLKEVGKGRYKLTTTQKVDVEDDVHLIVDANFEDEMLSQTKRLPIDIKIFARKNEPIKAEVEVCQQNTEIFGEVLQEADKQPLTAEELKINFNKSEMFEAKLECVELENVFMPKKRLNDFRRAVFEKIFDVLTKKYKKDLHKIKISTNQQFKKFENFQFVENIDEKFVKENIIYSPSEYILDDIKTFQAKCVQENKKAFLDTPNFAVEEDIKFLKEIVNVTKIAIVANNYYALTFDTEIVVGGGLNVYNSISANELGLPVITAESELANRQNFAYMTLRHCPFKSNLSAGCQNCPYQKGYCYRMESGKLLKIKRKKLSSCTFYLTD